MKRILGQRFFTHSAPVVAERLIGTFLVRRQGRRERAYLVTETEAYDGFDDKASHAARGKTARNSVMFGDAGHWYVYLIYGMHCMLNVVTGKRGYPSAVLIRGVAAIVGPGKLTRELHITRGFNKKPAARRTKLWFETRGAHVSRNAIRRTARIGVSYAGKKWANKKWRFVYCESQQRGRA